LRLKDMYNHVDEDSQNTVSEAEVEAFLVECGHKEPDEDDIATVMDALDREGNANMTFAELWDWFMGSILVEKLGDTPQMKVRPEIYESSPRYHEERGSDQHRQELMGRSPRDLLRNFKQTQSEQPSPTNWATQPKPPKFSAPMYSPRSGMPLMGSPGSPRNFTARPQTSGSNRQFGTTASAYKSQQPTARNFTAPRLPPHMRPSGFYPSAVRPHTCASGYRV